MTKTFCNKCEKEITDDNLGAQFYCRNYRNTTCASLLIRVLITFEAEDNVYSQGAKDLHFCKPCLIEALTK